MLEQALAMLHWAPLQTVFGAHRGAKETLDAMLPELKAMPLDAPLGPVPQ